MARKIKYSYHSFLAFSVATKLVLLQTNNVSAQKLFVERVGPTQASFEE